MKEKRYQLRWLYIGLVDNMYYNGRDSDALYSIYRKDNNSSTVSDFSEEIYEQTGIDCQVLQLELRPPQGTRFKIMFTPILQSP